MVLRCSCGAALTDQLTGAGSLGLDGHRSLITQEDVDDCFLLPVKIRIVGASLPHLVANV